MRAYAFAVSSLRQAVPRLAGLGAFALVFLAAAGTARLLSGPGHDHVELDQLFVVGGYPLVSALLLLGWLIGRFPLIATLVLMAGIVAGDRGSGAARLHAVRPGGIVPLYAARWLTLALAAFLGSATLLPAFDLIMLGTWAGPATFVLIAANVAVYGGLVALLSVFTRADAWIALLLAALAIVWDGLARAGALPLAGPIRSLVAMALPPQSALFALESAFGEAAPIPWDAAAHALVYGALLLVLAGAALARREL